MFKMKGRSLVRRSKSLLTYSYLNHQNSQKMPIVPMSFRVNNLKNARVQLEPTSKS